MEKIWHTIKTRLKEQIPAHMFKMWVEPLQVLIADQTQLVLACPNPFFKKRVNDYYWGLIQATVNQIVSPQCCLKLEIAAPEAQKPQASPVAYQLDIPGMSPTVVGCDCLCQEFTFDQFVVGDNNGFAYSAARALASTQTRQQSPLFLFSKTGLGKSHLAQAVGNHIIGQRTSESVFYMNAEDFTNEMVNAFKNNTVPAFKHKYYNDCDVLLLEDVQMLSGKQRTQIELTSTLDKLSSSGKRVVFSSSCSPAEIPKLNDKLRSRLSGSIVSVIEPPGYKTRIKILQNKARRVDQRISPEVIQYLATELVDDVRQLQNGLMGTATKASLLGIPMDVNLARSVVKTMVQQRQRITIDAIKALVSKQYNVSVPDLVSKSRKQAILRPRQIAIYLARQYTDHPLQVIGRSFNRYHATALHSINAVEQNLKGNHIVQQQIEILRQRLESGRF